jgi:hypothetical protein
MSEYQYYEFLAIDRPLDEQQRAELRALSTRARITATSFVNEYHWGDFRGNPAVLMERYFDAFLYLANWGTRRLMIRLPRDLLDLGVAERYCTGDAASAWAASDRVILSLSSEDEDEYWEEGEGRLASIALVRSELAAGDLRLLYLAWLLSVQAEEVGDEEAEPPLPPGLRALSAPLRAVADFLRLDEDLLTAAATASAEVQTVAESAGELARWIEDLPGAEKDALLVQAARGEGSQARHARAAAAAREQRLDALALWEEQAWQHVDSLIGSKKPREYDAAVAGLLDLQALAERAGNGKALSQRFRQLREQDLRKPSLIRRFENAGLGAEAQRSGMTRV